MRGDYAAKQVRHLLDQAVKTGAFGNLRDVAMVSTCMDLLDEAAGEYDKSRAQKEEATDEAQN